jgi:hypothetical protein
VPRIARRTCEAAGCSRVSSGKFVMIMNRDMPDEDQQELNLCDYHSHELANEDLVPIESVYTWKTNN